MNLLPHPTADAQALRLDNTADAAAVALDGVTCIELSLPKFTDGRAYSQARVLRRRGFAGDIRATGDVLVDQLVQMQRCGFSSAVLRADQSMDTARRLLSTGLPNYQGDARQPLPHFARESA
ncbi:MAG: hypothetical protein RL657_1492 [Pseudomonadota bacterium]|jgi:uncharacterized protein (DUF934 family)